MIEVKGISKKYGETIAVNNISFEVKAHENLILLGTSGCGKTTTLKMLNRLIEPDNGQIFINGEDVIKQNPEKLRRGVGYVMQNTGLFPHYTIEENISVVPKLLGWKKSETANRINELIEKLHLPQDSLKLFPNQLSGGQQQRVGLARALVANPSVLLMDEPFGALDNVTRNSIRKEFKDLEELKRKTIVMVTHDVQEAFELGDRICLMDKGEIMQIGTPKELLFNPANNFSAKFLEGEKLALEFKIIRIEDVWNSLPEASKVDGIRFSPELTVWDAMEKLQSANVSELIFCSKEGVSKKVNFHDLTSAFNQFKNSHLHE